MGEGVLYLPNVNAKPVKNVQFFSHSILKQLFVVWVLDLYKGFWGVLGNWTMISRCYKNQPHAKEEYTLISTLVFKHNFCSGHTMQLAESQLPNQQLNLGLGSESTKSQPLEHLRNLFNTSLKVILHLYLLQNTGYIYSPCYTIPLCSLSYTQ